MLLPNMTFQEIRVDLLRDLPEILHRTEKYFPQFRRMLIKTKQRTKGLVYFKKMTSRNKIKWEVRFTNYEGKKDGYSSLYGAYYHNKKGIRFINFDYLDHSLQIYNSHFYRRYNERMNLQLEDNIRAINQVFLTKNSNGCHIMEEEKVEKGIRKVVAQIPEGLKFGTQYIRANTIVWNTFVSQNEYKGNQSKMKDLVIKYLKVEQRLQEYKYRAHPGKAYLNKMVGEDSQKVTLKNKSFQQPTKIVTQNISKKELAEMERKVLEVLKDKNVFSPLHLKSDKL